MADRLGAAPARLARRARRLFGYWRSERRTLRQGSVALVLSTCAGFVAGLVLGSITGTLEKLPGLLVLIPASVGMRGTIFGAMGARFGTGVAAGIFEPTLERGSLLARNVSVGILSTLLSSFYLAAVAKLVASAFAKEAVISFWDLVTISVIGGVLASLIALVFTVGIAVVGFRKGWDLDAVTTPMVTAIGDMVTLPTLFLATLLVGNTTVNAVAAVLCTAATAVALVAAFRAEVGVRRILLEMVAVVALSPLLDIFAGALLQAHSSRPAGGPRRLDPHPPVRLASGSTGRDPLLAPVVQAPARRDHPPGTSRDPGRRRRRHRHLARLPRVHGDRRRVLGAVDPHGGSGPQRRRLDRRHAARGSDRACRSRSWSATTSPCSPRASGSTRTTRAFPSSRRSWTSRA